MTPVYDAANSTDAYLIKHLLEQAGIACFIRGEYLQGGLGDLPVNGMVQVCVRNDDAARARAIVVDWNESVPLADDGEADDDNAENSPSGGENSGGTTSLRVRM